MNFVGLLVILALLIALVPVLGALAIAGAAILTAVFAVGLILRLVGGTVRFGLDLAQLAIGLLVSLASLLLLAGTLGVIGVFFLKLWPLLLIGLGVYWLLRRR